MNRNSILIAGGDMRQLSCAASLIRKYPVAVIGSDRTHYPDGLDAPENDCFDYLVLPVPPLDEDGNVSTPLSKEELTIEEVTELIRPDALVLAGRVDKELRERFPGHRLIDYMEREELCLSNAIPTAEGAVQIALEELPVTLSGAKVLIVGMGRIGTALAEILKGFGADISVLIRDMKGAARARIHGITPVYASDMSYDHDVVFNTVPGLVFSRDVLGRFKADTLFIDLASKPGGIDFDSASQLGIKTIWALGLPGRTAPVTAGNIIADTIDAIIREEGGSSRV